MSRFTTYLDLTLYFTSSRFRSAMESGFLRPPDRVGSNSTPAVPSSPNNATPSSSTNKPLVGDGPRPRVSGSNPASWYSRSRRKGSLRDPHRIRYTRDHQVAGSSPAMIFSQAIIRDRRHSITETKSTFYHKPRVRFPLRNLS